MNKEIKDKWLCALESGDFAKGEKALCTEQGGKRKYCCLGVLADVLGTQWRKENDYRPELKSINDDSTSYLGHRALDQTGISGFHMYELASLNDKSDSFAPVIDYIREKL